MIEFRGIYFDGRSSRPHQARLLFDGRVLRIKGVDVPLLFETSLADCRIEPPLGGTSRIIRLPGGASCESTDAEALAELDKIAGGKRGLWLVNSMENHWKTVLLSLAGLVLCVAIFHAYGIPLLARGIAFSVPVDIAEVISNRTMQIIDTRFLKPSGLGREKTEEIRQTFHELLKSLGPDSHTYRLEFRKSPLLGPNAFALPSGLVVVTDELVALSGDRRELEGILLHEIAHVKERHALRLLVQDAGVFFVVQALAGDLSAISSTAASLPTILAQRGYSREFEREADRFAALYFSRRGWDIKPMTDILARISKERGNYPGESLLSTHPVTDERIRYLKTMAGKR